MTLQCLQTYMMYDVCSLFSLQYVVDGLKSTYATRRPHFLVLVPMCRAGYRFAFTFQPAAASLDAMISAIDVAMRTAARDMDAVGKAPLAGDS